ncbi:MAG: dUTP diphosphatase [Candidatus Dojkabacteria bacterium]|nr:dUTP diphosphatase [Candidatus Dojkabacteria bacterium]
MSLPTLKVQRLFPDAQLPKRAHPTDSAVDLYAYRFETLYREDEPLDSVDGVSLHDLEEIVLKPMDRVLINPGLSATVGGGYEIQLRSRSGLALKQGLSIVNGIGTIDEQYRGPLGVILGNYSNSPQTIAKGDRIAQLVVSPVILCDIEELQDLGTSQRGTGGFGSTGKR